MPLLPSLLDRLTDEAPDRRREAERSRVAMLRDIRDGIRRDLENLLNTRCIATLDDSPMQELRTSLLTYGLPDFSRVQLGAEADREALRRRIQEAIRRFETRLANVSVALIDSGAYGDRTLHLKISALLMVEPDPVSLVFDSRIHTLDRKVRLQEVYHG